MIGAVHPVNSCPSRNDEARLELAGKSSWPMAHDGKIVCVLLGSSRLRAVDAAPPPHRSGLRPRPEMPGTSPYTADPAFAEPWPGMRSAFGR
jgi:hypothetical protein